MDDYKITGFWRRLAAFIYDTLVIISILLLGSAIATAFVTIIWGQQAVEDGILFGSNLFRLFLLLLWFNYFSLSWMKGGQTLGMKPWRLYVFDNKGNCINFKQSLQRFFSALLGLGLFFIPFLAEKKSLQDLLSSSRTMVKPKPARKN